METLQLLGLALGLASLSGVNLYLTVFLSGLAIRFQWLTLSEPYTSLAVLSDPVVLTIAGIFFFLEFFADKIPWVDTIWDSVHTFIRPVGAALLAILVLGEPSPVLEVAAALLAGGTALATHSIKATSRLVVNASPEPFSNIAVSLAEDALVVGGLATLAWNPLAGLAIASLALAFVLFVGLRLFRLMRSRTLFAWHKLTASTDQPENASFSSPIPIDLDCLLHQQISGEVRVASCLPCTSGKIPSTPPNIRGYLVTTHDSPSRIFWAGKVGFRFRIVPLDLSSASSQYQKGFLYDKATFLLPSSKKPLVLLFDRSVRPAAEHAISSLFSPPSQPSENLSAPLA